MLDVIDEEKLQENCANVGTYFLNELAKLRDGNVNNLFHFIIIVSIDTQTLNFFFHLNKIFNSKFFQPKFFFQTKFFRLNFFDKYNFFQQKFSTTNCLSPKIFNNSNFSRRDFFFNQWTCWSFTRTSKHCTDNWDQY